MTAISLHSITSHPAPFDQNPENSSETAFRSDPIGICGYLQANRLSDLFQRFSLFFATGQNGKNRLMAHDLNHIHPPICKTTMILDKIVI